MSKSHVYGKYRGPLDERTFREAKRIASNHRSKFFSMNDSYLFSTDDRGEVENKAEENAVFDDLRAAGLYELMYPGGSGPLA